MPQSHLKDIQDCVQELQQAVPGRLVHFHWIRAHIGLEGNEIADTLAKEGANLTQATLPQPYEIIKGQELWHQKNRWQEYWNNNPTAALYHQLGNFERPKPDPMDSIQRTQYTIIESLRMNRYPTASNLQKIGKHPNGLCKCQQVEDVEHLLQNCPLTQNQRQLIWGSQTPALTTLLFGNESDLKKTTAFIKMLRRD